MVETELERAEKRYAQASVGLTALRTEKVILGGALVDLAGREATAATLLDRLVRYLPREQDHCAPTEWSPGDAPPRTGPPDGRATDRSGQGRQRDRRAWACRDGREGGGNDLERAFPGRPARSERGRRRSGVSPASRPALLVNLPHPPDVPMTPDDEDLYETVNLLSKVVGSISDHLGEQTALLAELAEVQAAASASRPLRPRCGSRPKHTPTPTAWPRPPAIAQAVHRNLVPHLHKIVESWRASSVARRCCASACAP